MSIEVKVGQVWQDKDKRRDTRIEIIAVPSQKQGDAEATGLVVGTEETRTYQIDRLVKRWKLIKEAPEPVKVSPAAPRNWQLKAVCKHNDDMKVRLTTKIAETYGMPICPCHREHMIFTERRA